MKQVPLESKKQWDLLHEHGDIAKIVEQSGYSRPTISGALDGGGCTLDVFHAIQKFYNQRQAEINSAKTAK